MSHAAAAIQLRNLHCAMVAAAPRALGRKMDGHMAICDYNDGSCSCLMLVAAWRGLHRGRKQSRGVRVDLELLAL